MSKADERVRELKERKDHWKKLKGDMLREWFVVDNRTDVTDEDLEVFYLIRSYDVAYLNYYLPPRMKRFFKGVAGMDMDARKNGRIWGRFKLLYQMMKEMAIRPRTYWYYFMKIRSKKVTEYWWLCRVESVKEFWDWYGGKKRNGDDPDSYATYTVQKAKQNEKKYWMDVMRKEMDSMGIKEEREYWLNLLPEDVARFPLEFLKRNAAYRLLCLQGEMDGPGFPNPISAKAKV